MYFSESKFVCIALSCFVSFASLGQADSTSANPNRITVLADCYADSVVLRWAPLSPALWQTGNVYGYTIERYVLHNGENAEEDKQVLAEGLKPLPSDRWESLIANYDRAAIVYEMIYGEQENTETVDFVSVMKKHRELSMRFGFALFVCDLHPQTASAAALRYVDGNIEPGKRYIYVVKVSETPEGLNAESGAVVAKVGERFRMPAVMRFNAFFFDRKVDLAWPVGFHKGYYTAYIIERSDDGVNFAPIADTPITPASETDEIEMAWYTDSLPENGKVYHYRVKGLTPFGTESEPSETVVGAGRVPFAAHPVIDTAYETPGGFVQLRWRVETDSGARVKELNVLRAYDVNGPYSKANPAPLPPSATSYEDKPTEFSIYYRIQATGENPFQEALSFARFISLDDSIPPAPPSGLAGKADTSGTVLLSWEKNSEPDLFGYRVFRANGLDEEFAEITSTITQETSITDTIYLRTITPKVYYKLIALDRRYNPSEYSEVLAIDRPDVIPPVPPVITRSGADVDGIFIYWEYGPSEDVAGYELYLTNKNSGKEELLESWESNPLKRFYSYNEIEQGETYCFKITATDKSGNKSEAVSRDLIWETGLRPGVADLAATIDHELGAIKLTWKRPRNAVERYLIYRSYAAHPFVLYATVSGNDVSWTDTQVKTSNTYVYGIKVMFDNGAESSLSKKVEAKY